VGEPPLVGTDVRGVMSALDEKPHLFSMDCRPVGAGLRHTLTIGDRWQNEIPAIHMKAEFDPVIIGQAGSALCFSDL